MSINTSWQQQLRAIRLQMTQAGKRKRCEPPPRTPEELITIERVNRERASHYMRTTVIRNQ